MRTIIGFLALGAMLLTPTIATAGPGGLSAPVDSDFHDDGAPPVARVELGRLLFFDKILSGNRNVSCASCHHPLTGTGDGLSLPVGEGGRGLGPARDTGSGAGAVPERVPRNAPAVFNLGAREFERMFHDGRVEADPLEHSGFRTPAGDDLPTGLANVLAAQAMFPVTSNTEMAGQPGENAIADAAAAGRLTGLDGVWQQIALRLQAVPEYVRRFADAFPAEVLFAGDISYVHAANAIAAFEAAAWRFDDSPFDRFLRGDPGSMSPDARRGMALFYGRANCSSCHEGPFQTDHRYHAIAMPQIGPGKGDRPPGYQDGLGDFGRERVSGDPADRYRFRTPSLRNVAVTAPYGHAGAFGSLEAVVRHHLDPEASLHAYDPQQAILPRRTDLDESDFALIADADRRGEIALRSELEPTRLSGDDLTALLAFLHALTDPAVFTLPSDIPERVPSGLPVWD
ncbi:MAG: cytochrome-c peroxidase [Xanthomonadales bacterium]|nr:cytochrome-c peroxidase [Xanthomonadales bacterium]